MLEIGRSCRKEAKSFQLCEPPLVEMTSSSAPNPPCSAQGATPGRGLLHRQQHFHPRQRPGHDRSVVEPRCLRSGALQPSPVPHELDSVRQLTASESGVAGRAKGLDTSGPDTECLKDTSLAGEARLLHLLLHFGRRVGEQDVRVCLPEHQLKTREVSQSWRSLQRASPSPGGCSRNPSSTRSTWCAAS